MLGAYRVLQRNDRNVNKALYFAWPHLDNTKRFFNAKFQLK